MGSFDGDSDGEMDSEEDGVQLLEELPEPVIDGVREPMLGVTSSDFEFVALSASRLKLGVGVTDLESSPVAEIVREARVMTCDSD